MKLACLDLGSNSFLLLVCSVSDENKIIQVFRDETRVVKLAQGVHESKEFHPEALKRVDACFKEFRNIMNDEGVSDVVVAATSAARDVTNKSVFIDLGKKYGLPIQIIDGQREAHLTYLGSCLTHESASIGGDLVIDVGGGSTEIIGRNTDGEISGVSLNIGCVRLMELFKLNQGPKESDIGGAISYIRKTLSPQGDRLMDLTVNRCVAVAGTPSTLACLLQEKQFEEASIEGFKISRESMTCWVEKLTKLSTQERQELKGMQSNRADVILSGSLILLKVCEFLDISEIQVSKKGVRYGLALSYSPEKCI